MSPAKGEHSSGHSNLAIAKRSIQGNQIDNGVTVNGATSNWRQVWDAMTLSDLSTTLIRVWSDRMLQAQYPRRIRDLLEWINRIGDGSGSNPVLKPSMYALWHASSSIGLGGILVSILCITIIFFMMMCGKSKPPIRMRHLENEERQPQEPERMLQRDVMVVEDIGDNNVFIQNLHINATGELHFMRPDGACYGGRWLERGSSTKK